MVKLKVYDGTPEGGVSLCTTCHWALIRKGFRPSEEEVYCRLPDPTQRVTFKVSQCSKYSDVRHATAREMAEIAWILLTKKAGRSFGFVQAKEFREIEGEDADIVPSK